MLGNHVCLRLNYSTLYLKETKEVVEKEAISYFETRGYKCLKIRSASFKSKSSRYCQKNWHRFTINNREGAPDLLVFNNHSIFFCEIKSLLDGLKHSQFKWLQEMTEWINKCGEGEAILEYWVLFVITDEIKLGTTIQLEEITKERLKSFGQLGETYEDVIKRLIDFYEAHKK